MTSHTDDQHPRPLGLSAESGSPAERPEATEPGETEATVRAISMQNLADDGAAEGQPSTGGPADSTTPAPTDQQQQQEQQQPSSSAGAQYQWPVLSAAALAAQTRQRMSLASDQLNQSLRQLYVSASSIAGAGEHQPPSYHNVPGIVPFYQGRSSGPPPSYDEVINPYVAPPSYQSLFGQMREARKSSRGLIDLLRRLLIILVSTLGCTILIAFMILIPFTMIIVGAVYMDECRVEHIPAFLLVGGLVWAAKNIIHCYAQFHEPHHSGGALAGPASGAHSSEPEDAHSRGSLNADDFAGVLALDSPASARRPPGSMQRAHTNRSSATSASSSRSAASTTVSTSASSSSSAGAATRPHRTGALRSHNHHHHDHHHRLYHQHEQHASHGARAGRHGQMRLKSAICESLLNCILFGWFIAGCVIVFRNDVDFDNPASPRYCHRTVYMYTFWLIASAIGFFGLFVSCICCLMLSSAIASQHVDELA